MRKLDRKKLNRDYKESQCDICQRCGKPLFSKLETFYHNGEPVCSTCLRILLEERLRESL